MPWRETSAMDERLRFVQDVHRPGWSIAELCRRYEVSRQTGYKWLAAYERAGPAGLTDGSHRPHTSPQATAPTVVRLILDLQRRRGRTRPCRSRIRWIVVMGGCARGGAAIDASTPALRGRPWTTPTPSG